MEYRFGIIFDESPTPNAEATTVRLPDEDRTWLTFGLSYKKDERLSLDVSYAHIKIDDTGINKNANTPTSEDLFRGNLVGEYEADVHLLSLQGNWKFQT
ncbi:MAG: hypothetical protein E2O37_05220 [Proteobacteria bacterium]|nr:MAG: hypothetical protein E2O37_05220 [Pseudomonadota bacterium]